MPPKKGPRVRWDEAKEDSLLEIIEHGENGQIRKVIKERATNIKLKFEDAWTLVTEIYNKSWGTDLTKDKIRKKYNNILLTQRRKSVSKKGM